MRAVFWPTRRRDDAKFAVRFGRLIHWVMTGFAVLLFVVAPVQWLSNRSELASSKHRLAAWERDNPPGQFLPDGRVRYAFKLESGKFISITVPGEQTRQETYDHLQSQDYKVADITPPLETYDDNTDQIVMFVGGFFVFMAGRMMRYLIAGE